jgi:hypothetical protein
VRIYKRVAEMHYYEWHVDRWFMSETRARLSPVGRLVYRELLDICYRHGSVPSEPAHIATLLGVPADLFAADWDLIRTQFVLDKHDKGRMKNRHADTVRKQFFLHCKKLMKKRDQSRTKTVPSKEPEINNMTEGGATMGRPINDNDNERRETITRDDNDTHTQRAARAQTPRRRPTAADLTVQPSPRWEEFWQKYPRKIGADETCREWLSLVNPANEAAVFDCLGRYLASDEVSRGVVMNPARWLRECSRDGWTSDWPPAQPAQQSTTARRMSAAEEALTRGAQ